jgi:hypothetical protein
MIVGTVTGLSTKATVSLRNNGTEAINVSENGSFVFSGQVNAGSTYDVTVSTQPVGETCTVTNGVGTVGADSADVTNVLVTCVIVQQPR